MTFADRFLLVLLVPAIAMLYVATWQSNDVKPDRIEIVTPAGKQMLSLQQDQQLSLSGMIGDSSIEVTQQQVRFISSPCSNKFCIHQGWATHVGEVRACVPNRVSLRLLGQQASFDSIVF